MAKLTTIPTCQRVYEIMESETADAVAVARFGWTVDWARPATWGRLALAALHLLFIESMAPVLSLAIANLFSQFGWVSGMPPRSPIAMAIAFVLVVNLNRSVGANAPPWKELQGLPRNFGVLPLTAWCFCITFAGIVAGHTVMYALGFPAESVADTFFVSLMAGMVSTLSLGYVTYSLRKPTDPSSPASDGA